MAKRIIAFSDDVMIDRPIEEVFEHISDMPGLFAKLRRKAPLKVERLSGDDMPAAGDAWRISGNTRLGRRTGTLAVTDVIAPSHLSFHAEGRGFAVDTVITLTPLSRSRCQLEAANDLLAITFAARLLAPAIRLWRGRIKKGLGKGLKRLKRRLEA